jgi:hypothetical protein
VFLLPGFPNLEVKPKWPKIEDLCEATIIAASIIELLPHTPISAIGLNIGFLVADTADIQSVAENFEFADQKRIDVEQYRIRSYNLNRSYELTDDREPSILNLDVRTLTDGKIVLHFNFELARVSNQHYLESLTEEFVHHCFDKAQEMAKTLYSLSLCDDNDQLEDAQNEA